MFYKWLINVSIWNKIMHSSDISDYLDVIISCSSIRPEIVSYLVYILMPSNEPGRHIGFVVLLFLFLFQSLSEAFSKMACPILLKLNRSNLGWVLFFTVFSLNKTACLGINGSIMWGGYPLQKFLHRNTL